MAAARNYNDLDDRQVPWNLRDNLKFRMLQTFAKTGRMPRIREYDWERKKARATYVEVVPPGVGFSQLGVQRGQDGSNNSWRLPFKRVEDYGMNTLGTSDGMRIIGVWGRYDWYRNQPGCL